jgi:hypothetical protein
MHFEFGYPGITVTGNCNLYPGSSAVCVTSVGGTEANDPGMGTTTVSGTAFSYIPVVITAEAPGFTGGVGGTVATTTHSSTATVTASTPRSSTKVTATAATTTTAGTTSQSGTGTTASSTNVAGPPTVAYGPWIALAAIGAGILAF